VPLRIVVHDYSGFPFPVQLSRELARRGHGVLHLHCPSYRAGKGDLELREDDPPTLEIEPIDMGAQFAKYTPMKRVRQELTYGGRVGRRVTAQEPDVVLSGDTPLFAQTVILRSCRRMRVPFVFWLQDLSGIAMQLEAERRLPGGRMLGQAVVGLERKALERSAAVVAISEDFRETLLAWGLPQQKLHVIENWAPVDELTVRPRANEWARRHGLDGRPVLLYSGTLGLKHDPALLHRLATALPEVAVVVASEGLGADWLRERPLENLLLLGFQPYQELPEVLGTGDVLLVILERDAGRFAVPSKVLSYLCAGRPLLAALPSDNLAAKVVEASGAGLLVEPDDAEGLVDGGRRLLGDPQLRERLGAAGRAYAERTFDIGAIADRFEGVIASVVPASSRS
jgi:putative colanic acid biosynthesis glycosyltransferase WcaI